MSATDVRTGQLNVAVIGNPNTGKSTLFTALTGLLVKTGNYPGVTVERKVGQLLHNDHRINLIDLPGTYSLNPTSVDEQIAIEVLTNGDPKLGPIEVTLCVLNANNLQRGLVLASQLHELGQHLVIALNMSDIATQRGLHIDTDQLSRQLGDVPVIETSARKKAGLQDLLTALTTPPTDRLPVERPFAEALEHNEHDAIQKRYEWAERVAGLVSTESKPPSDLTDRIDKLITGPLSGLIIFFVLMFLIFQTLFTWAGPIMGLFEAAQESITEMVLSAFGPGPLRSLLTDGIIAGVGGVLIFIPQIALLFILIGILEDCGYMARAALVTDKFMSWFGLSGKSFLPLMSSYACAVPGIMATRTLQNRKERLITTLIAPLMSCSARLPVYVLLISVFVPETAYLGGLITLQGIVMFGMIFLGALIAIPVALLLNQFLPSKTSNSFLIELPDYHWPSIRTVCWYAYDQTKSFVMNAGTMIFCTAVVIWALAYFPGNQSALHKLEAQREAMPEDAPEAERLETEINTLSRSLIEESFLGRAGHMIEPVVRPCGWDWRIGTAVIASFPAREVVVATLGTIFSLGSDVDEENEGLRTTIRESTKPDGTPIFTLPVALSIMVFIALCAQCVSTLAIIKKETQSWKWPVFSFSYMTILAYLGAIITFQISSQFLA